MSFPVFGIEVENGTNLSPQKFQEFGTVVDREEISEPSTIKDVGKQIAKRGVAGATGVYGDLLDLLGFQAKEVLPGEKEVRGVESQILQKMQKEGYVPSVAELSFLSDDDITPRFSRLPSTEEATQFIEMLGGPGEAETAAGRIAGRGAEAAGAGAGLGGGIGTLLALLGGGIAGQTAEELGAPPAVGAGVELATALLPGAVAKKLVPGAKAAKELVKRGRAIGLTERELTPLLQKEGKLKTLGKVARKGKGVQKTLGALETKLGDAYGVIKEDARQLPRIKFDQSEKLIDKFKEINKDLKATLKASPDKESASNFIEGAMNNIRRKGVKPEELINFWQDINSSVNWRAIKGGKKQLAELKKPILEVLKKSSPELTKDFELTNKLYSKFKGAQKVLKKDLIDKWIDKGEIGLAAFGLATGNVPMLQKLATEAGVRTLSKEMLTNPYFQNLSRKLVQSLGKNKEKTTIALVRQAEKYLKKHHPDEEWEFGGKETTK